MSDEYFIPLETRVNGCQFRIPPEPTFPTIHCGSTHPQTTILLQNPPSYSELFNQQPHHYSEINPALNYNSDTSYVVSLVNNVSDWQDVRHVFLVMEGKTSSTSCIWFMDLISSAGLHKTKYGKVRTQLLNGAVGEQLLFNCQLPMMRLKGGDKIRDISYIISKEAGLKLLQGVNESHLDPPLFGQREASNINVHNSFTWAISQLQKLNCAEINSVIANRPNLRSVWFDKIPTRRLFDSSGMARVEYAKQKKLSCNIQVLVYSLLFILIFIILLKILSWARVLR